MNEELHESYPSPEAESWHKSFEVSSVSRSDLVTAGLSPEFVAGLTDEQMAQVAAKMGDYYTDQGYWEHVTIAVEHIMETDG
jgi:hypothetical protein